MAFSLALTRHRFAAARARSRRKPADAAPRPEGRLLWAYLSAASAPYGPLLLLDELVEAQSDLTIAGSGSWPAHPAIGLTLDPPGETSSASRRFLDHLRPDVILWIGADPCPVIWSLAARRGIPIVGVEVDPAAHPLALVRPMERFGMFLARRRDPRLDGEQRVIGALNAVPRPPRAPEKELERTAAALSGRRIWLAARVHPAEIDALLSAQSDASRLAHRLLLILEIGEDLDAAGLADALRARGWNVALRSETDAPGGETQILVVDDPDEIGLWVRLASMTFLGGTLGGEGPRIDPVIPASLGSVVLHGPVQGGSAPILSRLGAAGGACAVPDAAALGEAVERFLAPDKAAILANAAWEVTSEGAEATQLALAALEGALARIEPR